MIKGTGNKDKFSNWKRYKKVVKSSKEIHFYPILAFCLLSIAYRKVECYTFSSSGFHFEIRKGTGNNYSVFPFETFWSKVEANKQKNIQKTLKNSYFTKVRIITNTKIVRNFFRQLRN